MEKWEKIKGTKDYYISNQGRVKNAKTGNILKQKVYKNGFRNTAIIKNGKVTSINVFSVMVDMFLQKKTGKKVVLKNMEKQNGGTLDISIDNCIYIPINNSCEIILKRHEDKLEEICRKHNILFNEELLSGRRDKFIQKCRAECFAYLRNIGYQYEGIAKAFHFNSHATVLYAIKTHIPYADKIKNVKL